MSFIHFPWGGIAQHAPLTSRHCYDHCLSTEQNWTPNQIWNDGMLDPSKPLANVMLDDDPENFDKIGEDLHGPTPSFREKKSHDEKHFREFFSFLFNSTFH